MRRLLPTRPGTGHRSPWIAVALTLLWLGACQSAGDSPASEPVDGWRVVERLGHARFQPPGATDWLHVPASGVVPDGSRVVTGRGGRLILADAGRQVVASTASEFRLPYGRDPAWLEQSAGPVRYRVLDGAVLIVETSFFEADMAPGVLDVSVGPDGAEVRVAHGKARVLTPDGRTSATLEAGQAAAAERRGPEYRLARRGAGGMLEAVAPALQPGTESAGTAAKLGTPEARLLAGAAPARNPVALGRSSLQPAAVVTEAAASPSLWPAAELFPAPMPPAPQRGAQLAPPAPEQRLIPPAPARPSEARSEADADATRRAIERWAELPTKRADFVIVPARYPKAPADDDPADEDEGPGNSGPGGQMQSPAAEVPPGSRHTGGGPPKEERQIPFERLGAGLLDGLAPAEIRPRDPAGPQIAPARRL